MGLVSSGGTSSRRLRMTSASRNWTSRLGRDRARGTSGWSLGCDDGRDSRITPIVERR
jgi:hypothetical protein